MSYPRQVLPGSVYHVTRRCFQRRNLLAPSPLVNLIFMYCLAFAARLFEMKIHAFCVMSNHYHIILTDPAGRLPRFMEWLNKFTAKCINALRRRKDAVWSPTSSYNSVRQLDSEVMLKGIVYAVVNPVRALAVKRLGDWPGICIGPEHLGKKFSARRPPVFFRANGKMPDRVRLSISQPEAFSHLSERDFSALVAEEVEREEEKIRRQAAADGKRFKGRKAVLRLDPESIPPESTPAESQHCRHPRPKVACIDVVAKRRAQDDLRRFHADHRSALRSLKRGVRRVVFPAGTYLMKHRFGVRCASPDGCESVDGLPGRVQHGGP